MSHGQEKAGMTQILGTGEGKTSS
ncbi:hypothetical protein, partial [Klebsiella pneumoniae]